jgi:hypothetical protein
MLHHIGWSQVPPAEVLEALSIEDAIVKDSDKTWRLSPHGIDTVMDWFGLDRGQALRLCSPRVHGHLFTAEAQAMARALSLWNRSRCGRSDRRCWRVGRRVNSLTEGYSGRWGGIHAVHETVVSMPTAWLNFKEAKSPAF